MNIWFFIILILAFAIVIGPISMLRPSPAQQRKEQMRLQASKQGVRFGMRRLPVLKTDMDQPVTIPVYYLPPPPKASEVQEWILMRTSYTHEGNFYQEWDWQTDVRPNDAVCSLLKTYLPQLPASVPAITSSNLGISVFWLEKEGVEMLDLLIELLSKLYQIDRPITA